MSMQRRDFLKAVGAAGFAASALGGCATGTGARGPKVVVVGGGYSGATVAKYLNLWSNGGLDVTLVEANPTFISCPLSNLVLGGSKQIADLTTSYDGLVKRGIKVVFSTVVSVDPIANTVRLADQSSLPYDRLVLSPGIDFMYDLLPGLNNAAAQDKVLHSWKAGAQTVALRRQLEAMPNGGVYALSIPKMPYRCPPGPYERACQVAWYFKRAKPRSKVLILDGNPDVTSKKGLFMKAWKDEYQGIVEYRNNHVLTDVDVATLTAKFETAPDVKANVLNVIPQQRAGAIAAQAGVITANNRWCEVNFLTFESIKVPRIHVLGDSIQTAPGMPKSGHMANQQAKVAAAAIINLLAGQPPNPAPVINNTCYSFMTDRSVAHVASVHQYDNEKKTFLTVKGSGGVSPVANTLESDFAFSWARNIWDDALT